MLIASVFRFLYVSAAGKPSNCWFIELKIKTSSHCSYKCAAASSFFRGKTQYVPLHRIIQTHTHAQHKAVELKTIKCAPATSACCQPANILQCLHTVMIGRFWLQMTEVETELMSTKWINRKDYEEEAEKQEVWKWN